MSAGEGEPNPGSRPDALKNFLDHYRLTRRGFLKGVAVTASLALTEPVVKQTNVFSRVAEIVRKLAETAEVKIQTIENPIYFTDSLGRQRKWYFDNARHGIPPNDPDRPVGTVDDYINNSPTPSQYFQPKTSLYPETSLGPGIGVVIDGLIVDTSTGKGYMATGIKGMGGSDEPEKWNYIYPRLEVISDINNPTDHSDGARLVVKDGVGDVAQNGDYGSFYMGQDSQGKHINIVFYQSVDPSKNGTYRIRLDSQGDFVGSFFKVQEEGTPTPTPSPTPFRVWLPNIVR